MYYPYVYHIDLCILAYQLYNQTLIWPLDPWYERMRRTGTSRRDNFMEQIHRFVAGKPEYRGPGSTRGWATSDAFDPIVSVYSRLSPWTASFARDDAKYRVFNTPAYITDKITDVYVCEYETAPANDGKDYKSGKPKLGNHLKRGNKTGDVLYACEGGTGATVAGKILDAKPAAWSLMTFVLKRSRDDGGHDVHIVFRGSQSGSGGSAAVSGLLQEKGNPDWVTDTDAYETVSDTPISRYGKVSRGFANSLKLCLNSIVACLDDIDQNGGGKPKQIYVTGHSLGGALAAQFCSAMVLGEYGTNLPANLKAWPWAEVQLITYASPTVGNKEFQAAFNLNIDGLRIKVEGDPITQEKVNDHVGKEVQLASSYWVNTAAHEPALIRSSLIAQAQQLSKNLDNVVAIKQDDPAEPWKVYDTFWDMIDGHAAVRDHLSEILTDKFAADVDTYLAAFRAIIPADSTYRSPMTRKSVTNELLQKFDQAIGTPATSIEDLRDRLGQIAGVLDDQDDFLGVCLTLREVFRSGAKITIDAVRDDKGVMQLIGKA